MALNLQSYLALRSLLTIVPGVIVALTVRGFFRALAAKSEGDLTAEEHGLFSLNPAAHFNILPLIPLFLIIVAAEIMIPNKTVTGFLLLFFILFFGGSVHKGVPINLFNLKDNIKSPAKIAVYGILGKLLLALVCFYAARLMKFLPLSPYAFVTLSEIFSVTAVLAITFSTILLLPVPTFDGFAIFRYLWPRGALAWQNFIGPWAPIVAIALIILPGFNSVYQFIFFALSSTIKFLVFI